MAWPRHVYEGEQIIDINLDGGEEMRLIPTFEVEYLGVGSYKGKGKAPR